MQVLIFAILDQKAEAFLQPFFAATTALAFRNCNKACRNPESPFAQFPTDFTLYCIGEFDDESGALTPYAPMKNLGSMLQFLPDAADTAA
jgi:hypothetical protein